MTPLLRSIVADTTAEEHRGRAFGVLCLTRSLGSTLGGFVSTVLAGEVSVGLSVYRSLNARWFRSHLNRRRRVDDAGPAATTALGRMPAAPSPRSCPPQSLVRDCTQTKDG